MQYSNTGAPRAAHVALDLLLRVLRDTALPLLQVRKTALREVKLLRSLHHPNIVSLLDVFRQVGKGAADWQTEACRMGTPPNTIR